MLEQKLSISLTAADLTDFFSVLRPQVNGGTLLRTLRADSIKKMNFEIIFLMAKILGVTIEYLIDCDRIAYSREAIDHAMLAFAEDSDPGMRNVA